MKYNVFQRFYYATRYSLSGLLQAWRQEQAFRYEATTLLLLCIAMLVRRTTIVETLVVVGGWIVVIALELINSAVERAFDLIDKNYREEIKAGKDMLSASVFLAIIFNVAIWFWVFF